MFANRLRKNLKHLARWLKREEIFCYRLYDADLPEFALAIDVYEGQQRWVHVQEYQAPKYIDENKTQLRLQIAMQEIIAVLGIDRQAVFFKQRRQQKGIAQYEKLAAKQKFYPVREKHCQFLVNFEDYLDTGLFLDHRITRHMVGELAHAKHFLNLFAYTGSATVYAAKGGALSTTSVDMSNTYLNWAQRNLALNGLDIANHQFIQADCIKWLENNSQRDQYGLIFLDPPSFSTSKRMTNTLDVQRDHVALIKNAVKLLTSDGMLIFSNNLRSFKLDQSALAPLTIKDISRATLPKDFERNPKIHHCWQITAAQ